MLTTISKRFRWEMGHRLPMHSGLCRNLHGHSYAAEIFLTGEPDATGMVMDYFDLGALVSPLIDQLDHCFIVDRSDGLLRDFLALHGLKTVVMDAPTTAENLAVFFLGGILDQLPSAHTLYAITISIYETEKTSASITHEFNR
jgi:6-pyruvoyltetrahydropterin/6-carboxytetrahydropterin synthase